MMSVIYLRHLGMIRTSKSWRRHFYRGNIVRAVQTEKPGG